MIGPVTVGGIPIRIGEIYYSRKGIPRRVVDILLDGTVIVRNLDRAAEWPVRRFSYNYYRKTERAGMAKKDVIFNVRAATLGSREHATQYTYNRDPEIHSALQWLTYEHLPAPLKPFSAPFYTAATQLLEQIDQDVPELKATLNKLIEAKDAAVRAGIHCQQGRAGSVPRPQEVVDPPDLPFEPASRDAETLVRGFDGGTSEA